jgi:acyl-CoA thioesterase-1
MKRRFVLVAVLCVAASLAHAQEKKEAPNGKAAVKAKNNAAFAQVEDLPGLPRVLIIGDSISIGYTVNVRDLLKGVANVHRPPTNCGPTTNGIKNVESWLTASGGGKWDVIHFNWGLHDLKYVDEQLKNTSPEKGKLQVSPEDYEKNLETLVARMEKTGAKLIFATTTPVPAGEPQRKQDSDKLYNKVALKVMAKHHVAIDDLNAFVRAHPEGQLPNNVHYTPDGYKALAEQVAASIKAALGHK